MRATTMHATKALPARLLLVASLLMMAAWCAAGARADADGAPVTEEKDMLMPATEKKKVAVFDAASCGADAPQLVITEATEAADLTGVRWVKGDLTFGRQVDHLEYVDDDWHFVSEDVPAVARDLRCVEGALRRCSRSTDRLRRR